MYSYPNTIARWVWTALIADELVQISKPDQETTEFHSYMPYFMSMNLSDKSPYAAVANPNFHLWTHITCATVGSKRSKNARIVGQPSYSNTRLIACAYAYVLGTVMDIAKQFNEDGRPEEEEEETASIQEELEDDMEEMDLEDEAVLNNLLKEPDSMSGDDWLEYILANDKRLTEKMEKFCKKVWKKLGNCRPDTVGEYLFELSGDNVDLNEDRRDR